MNGNQENGVSKLPIKTWAEDDRPREKMYSKGRTVLTNAELIAILISSGNREESAVDVAKRILTSVNNDLNRLGELSLGDLMKFKGIGKAKAIGISAALELGRRRKEAGVANVSKVTTSHEAFEVLYPFLADLDHEQFYLMMLNRGNRLIEVTKISQGGVTGTVADNKLIFKAAIERLASSIIIAHNHPSGNLAASDADIKLTKSLKLAGELLDIPVVDHLIIAGKKYLSFADEGMI